MPKSIVSPRSIDKASLTKGIILLLVAFNIQAIMDGLAKYLAEAGHPVIQILWARFFFNALLIVPIAAWRHRGLMVRPPNPTAQIGRGLLHALGTFLLFTAYARMPLADALAIYYAYPFVVTALAPFLLGEHTGWRRWTAVIVGFAGTLMIIRPGVEVLNTGALFALIGSVAFALYLILTRKLAGSAPADLTLSYQSTSAAIVISMLVPFFWVTPDAFSLMLFVAIGAISALGHLMIIHAFERAPASYLAPFGYVEIITAAVIGFALFGDIPDYMTWGGIFVISASGIYIAWRDGGRASK